MGYLEFKKYATSTPLSDTGNYLVSPGARNPDGLHPMEHDAKTIPERFAKTFTPQEQQRRLENVPASARQQAMDTAMQYKYYLSWRQARGMGLPDNVTANTTAGQKPVQYATSVQPTQQQPQKPQQPVDPTKGFDIKGAYKELPKPIQLGVQDALEAIKPGANVLELGKIDKDVFNSEEFRNLETNEEKMEYLQRVATKAGIFSALYQKDENGKVKATGVIGDIINDPNKLYDLPDKVLSNPEFFDSLVSAVENSKDTDTIKFLQWAKDQTAASKSQTGSTEPGTGEAGTSPANTGLSVKLTEEQESKLTSAAAKSLWNQIKADPITTIPKAAGLFLNQIGMGGMASFAENPFVFYLSLAGLLLGGGALLFGGSRQPSQPQVVINNGPQADPRMTQVPYGV